MKVLDNEVKITREWLRSDLEIEREVPCQYYSSCLARYANAGTLCGGNRLSFINGGDICPFCSAHLSGNLTYIIPNSDLVDLIGDDPDPNHTFMEKFDVYTGKRRA